MREMVGGCCVCSDDRGWSENPLVYCDGQSCSVAVHQACYGIVTVPTGPWYCRKCESQERSVKVKCELCPSKYGALKRTDNSGWAHVVCALYIPEVRFGNVTTMEPIQLQLIPAERFNKVCYICEEKGKASSAAVGACMQCNKVGCKQQFHVTCAQSLGLLCEEAGNYLDNVKYCGYCQHHYSKLKKGGNVKTIPPYKPVNYSHNSDSNSEKELESGPSNVKGNTPPTGKRKTSAGNKSGSSKASSVPAKASSTVQQKPVHNNSKTIAEKSKLTNSKSAKSDDSAVTDIPVEKNEKKDTKTESPELDNGKEKEKENTKSSKKRKVNSRTPTPVGVVQSEVSVVVSTATTVVPVSSTTTLSATTTSTDKKNALSVSESTAEKSKKLRIETTQSIISNQPVVALTSISTIKINSPAVTLSEPVVSSETITQSALPTSSIIHTAQAQSAPQPQPFQQQFGSLVVSVPLANASLSPHNPIISNNQTSVLASTPVLPERNSSVGSAERSTPVPNILTEGLMMTGGNSNQGVLTSEMSGGGLKITYEKQPDSINTEVDMELEPSTIIEDVPAKRGRSQSTEKTDRTTRNKKRNSATNGIPSQQQSINNTLNKRSSRSQHSSPPPQQGAFAVISQSQIKDSPPSSPSSESQGAPPSTSSRSRMKTRKSAPAAVGGTSSSSGFPKETKDIKIFQNGISTAPHMLGNQLNPNSTMHQKMTDHLSSEMEAHSIYNPHENNSNLVGPQMHHRVVQSARASSTGSSTASGGSGLSSMLGGGGGTIPQTLDQLLERQWEQGSQFLMEQAQHFDIASLLSCLHQLRAENLRLEEHVGSLLQRRDHLLAVNARLAIPLTGQPATPQHPHAHTVNNIHPNLVASHGDVPRSSRHSSSSTYDRHSQSSQHGPIENGLPPDAYPQNPHRSPAGGQPSPTVRHSPAGSYSNSSLHRQGADSSGRSAPRPQPYPLYDRPGSSAQQQMVIRRDRDPDLHHLSSKPS